MKILICCVCLALLSCGETERIKGRDAKEWLNDLSDRHPEVRNEAVSMIRLSEDEALLERARPALRKIATEGNYNAASLLYERFREVDEKWVDAFAQFAASSDESQSALRDLYATHPTAVRVALMKQVEFAEKKEHSEWEKEKIEDFLIGLIADANK